MQALCAINSNMNMFKCDDDLDDNNNDDDD